MPYMEIARPDNTIIPYPSLSVIYLYFDLWWFLKLDPLMSCIEDARNGTMIIPKRN